jgi:hypothetical protein
LLTHFKVHNTAVNISNQTLNKIYFTKDFLAKADEKLDKLKQQQIRLIPLIDHPSSPLLVISLYRI